jgi:hypothetical protein
MRYPTHLPRIHSCLPSKAAQFEPASPPKTGAIAIMTDTDNTGGDATAYYGPIRISTLKLYKQTGEDIANLT